MIRQIAKAFAGRHVLIAGGAGTVGSGIVESLLKQGAKVTVTTRTRDRFDALKSRVPADVSDNLFVAVGDVSTEEGVKTIFDTTTKQNGGVQHVVASIGSFWDGGKIVDQPLAEFNQGIKDRVTGHFLLFKTFVPYLDQQQDSTYTIITGNAGDKYIVPDISMLCVTSGALHGLAVAAVAENKDSKVAVNEFRIHCLVYPQRDGDMPASNPYDVGHDIIGDAVAASIAKRTRDPVNVHNRQEIKDYAK